MFSIKKLAGLVTGLVLLSALLAPAAQAASLTSAQVSAIVSLLQSFDADATTISNVQAALGGPSTPSSNASCLTLSYNLYAGLTDSSTNGQVSQLQQFLGVPSVTGYFGSLTQQAVQKWQAAHGISSTGYVGPATRAVIACSGQSNTTTNGSASASTNQQNDLTANVKEVQTAEAAFNVNVLNEMVSVVNTANASSLTDIPYSKAFANQWGATLLAMQAQLQTLQQSNLTTISSSDLDSLISTYMQFGSKFNQALAAFNTLPSSELTAVLSATGSSTSTQSSATSSQSSPPASSTASAPLLMSASPSQGTVGSQIIVTGTGLVTNSGNTLYFDGVSLGSANAVNGTLNFTVPSIVYPSCSNSSCAGVVITPGSHYITVQNANGQSNLKLLFTVLSSGGATATLNPPNFITLSNQPVFIQGSASGTTQVIVALSTPQSGTVWNSGPVAVTNGQWSVTTAPLASGIYTMSVVQVGGNGTALATGTLTAQ